jgi:G:T-mismatch repair DNA endonuclease (very short patch repair protein)
MSLLDRDMNLIKKNIFMGYQTMAEKFSRNILTAEGAEGSTAQDGYRTIFIWEHKLTCRCNREIDKLTPGEYGAWM